jgi:acetoin utilization deacetylase AcuC-like enzyme
MSLVKIFTNKPHIQYANTTNNKPFQRQSVILDALITDHKWFKTEFCFIDKSIPWKDVVDSGIHHPDMLDFISNAYGSYMKAGFDHHHKYEIVNSDGTKRIGLIPAVCNSQVSHQVKMNLPYWKRVGIYCNEFTTPIFEDTMDIILESVTSSITAAKELIANPNCVPYALTSSPGHHAGSNYYSGYCYLNNAYFAANELSTYGKVGIIDLDYHAGDGSKDIYDHTDKNIYPISININPTYDYPHYVGFNDDQHFLTFEPGCNIHFYTELINRAKQILLNEECEYIVVTFGGDTYKKDPEVLERSRTCIDIPDYIEIGRCIGEFGLPTMVVQEGGYDMSTIGSIVTNFLKGLIEKKNDQPILQTKKTNPIFKSTVKSEASFNVFSTKTVRVPIEKNYDNGLKSEDSDTDSDTESDTSTLPVKKVEFRATPTTKSKTKVDSDDGTDSDDSDDSNDSDVLE